MPVNFEVYLICLCLIKLHEIKWKQKWMVKYKRKQVLSLNSHLLIKQLRSRHTLLNSVRSNLKRSFSERWLLTMDCKRWASWYASTVSFLSLIRTLSTGCGLLYTACSIGIQEKQNNLFFYETQLLNRKTHLHWLYTVSQFLGIFIPELLWFYPIPQSQSSCAA